MAAPGLALGSGAGAGANLDLGSTDIGMAGLNQSVANLPAPSPTTANFDDGFFGTYGFPLMMASGAVSAIGDISQTQNQANALKTQAGFSSFQAQQATTRAALGVEQVQKQEGQALLESGARANATMGAQRAAYAAGNANVNTGTPLAEQVATGQMSSVDALTIRNNAALEAYGIQLGGIQQAGQQELEALGETGEATQTLALGGAKAANDIMSQIDTYESMRARGW